LSERARPWYASGMSNERDEPISWPSGNASEWEITFEWEIVEGRPEPVGIHVVSVGRDRAVTATLMRSIPIATLASKRRAKAKSIRQAKTKAAQKITDLAKVLALQEREVIQLRGGGRPGRPATPIEDLAEVAKTYRLAYLEGRPPTQAVVDWHQITHRTAAKRVARCRKLGLLGPAPGRGQAGERFEEEN